MSLFGLGRNQRTFRPKKSAPSGSKGAQLRKHIDATLGSGNLREAVRLPPGEDANEWLAVNTVDFFNQVNLLYGTLTEFCTPENCPTMTAGPKYEYRWADGVQIKKPIEVSAPKYVEYLMDWIEVQLDDESIFPQKLGKDDAPTLSMDLEETGRSLRSSFRLPGSLSERSSSISSLRNNEDDEYQLQWAAIERLPTFERLRKSVFDPSKSESGVAEETEKRVVDVTKLGALERRLLVEKLIKHIENDNLRLLMKQKERIDRVNVKLPTIEVRYKNLSVEAECVVVQGKPLPTLWNTAKSIFLDDSHTWTSRMWQNYFC